MGGKSNFSNLNSIHTGTTGKQHFKTPKECKAVSKAKDYISDYRCNIFMGQIFSQPLSIKSLHRALCQVGSVTDAAIFTQAPGTELAPLAG